jgi:hypothetical protein
MTSLADVEPGIDDEVTRQWNAHFTLTESGKFEPTRFAGSHWGDNHLNGPAAVGVAARTLELHHGSPDFMPTRLWAADGIAVGTATLFDRSGAFGSGTTTAVANPAAQIDFANDPFPLRIP